MVMGCAGDVNFTVGMAEDMSDGMGEDMLEGMVDMGGMDEYPLMPPPHPASKLPATLSNIAPHRRGPQLSSRIRMAEPLARWLCPFVPTKVERFSRELR